MRLAKQINKLKDKAIQFENELSIQAPSNPMYSSPVRDPFYDDSYRIVQSAIETSDHPSLIEATFKAIMVSDNPMIQAELKKLYMLAKLAIPADEPYTSTVRKQLDENARRNRAIEAENESIRRRYEMAVAEYNQSINLIKSSFTTWWGKVVDDLEAIFSDSKLAVWPHLLEMAITGINSTNKILGPHWKRRKQNQFAELRVVDIKIANLVLDAISKEHRRFINNEAQQEMNRLCKLPHNAKHIRCLEEVMVRSRRIVFTEYGPDYYGDDKYGWRSDDWLDSRVNEWTYNRDQTERHCKAKLDVLQAELTRDVWQTLVDRQAKGVEGYETIYSVQKLNIFINTTVY